MNSDIYFDVPKGGKQVEDVYVDGASAFRPGATPWPALNKNFLPPGKWVDGEIEGVKARWLQTTADERGWLLELYRTDELTEADVTWPTMAYLSTTQPGVTRGPHEHERQTDLFVFIGTTMLYLWDNRPHSPTYGNRRKIVISSSPVQVVVPPGVVHAYKNSGYAPLTVFNGPDELYAGYNKSEPVDEVRHEKDLNTVFKPW